MLGHRGMADDRREAPLASASSDEEQLPTDPSGFALDTDSDDDPEAGGWTSFSQLEQELRDSLEQTISANHNTNELVGAPRAYHACRGQVVGVGAGASC